MKHLKIILDSILSEQVDPSIISKLAAWTQAGLDNASELVGSILVNYIKNTTKSFLETSHPNLHITPVIGYYEDFGDEVLEERLSQIVGDGIGVRDTDLSKNFSISFVGGDYWATRRSQLLSVTTLSKFTGTITIPAQAFWGCNSLVEIDLRNLNIIWGADALGDGTFLECNNLRTLHIDTFPVTKLIYRAFYNCYALEGSLNFPNLTTWSASNVGSAFAGCSSITKISLGHVTAVTLTSPWEISARGAFARCTNLKIVDYGDSITSWTSNLFYAAPNVKALVFRVNVPPTNDATQYSSNNYSNPNVKIYVPDDYITDWKTAANWDQVADKIVGLSTYNEASILLST